jgi:HK97 gp10 family phage protein|tara:strand:- start:323 stop:763 length:441 start_codon:yes stop_codon:yes gene_type:complete
MADQILFRIEGLDALITRLGKLAPEIAKEVAMEVNASALAIQSKARRDVVVDNSTLRSSIQLKEINRGDKIMYTVGSRLKYAPYVEFGTGGTVNVPAGYEDFAMQFKGKGIRKINLRPRPYLIPAFESEIPILRKNIQNVIKNVKS